MTRRLRVLATIASSCAMASASRFATCGAVSGRGVRMPPRLDMNYCRRPAQRGLDLDGWECDFVGLDRKSSTLWLGDPTLGCSRWSRSRPSGCSKAAHGLPRTGRASACAGFILATSGAEMGNMKVAGGQRRQIWAFKGGQRARRRGWSPSWDQTARGRGCHALRAAAGRGCRQHARPITAAMRGDINWCALRE